MLIKCPECGKEISNKSSQCIHCGYPIANNATLKSNNLYTIKLIKINDKYKAKTAQKIREITGFGLKEAVDVINTSPSIIIKGLSYEKCKEIQDVFNTCGAITEIIEDNESTVPNTSLDNYNISDLKKDIRIQSQVHCPYCNSINVNKISSTKKAMSIVGFGILSNKIGKQWHCNNCKSDF